MRVGGNDLKIKIIVAGILFFLANFAQSEDSDFAKYVRLASEGSVEKAYSQLLEQSDKKFSDDKLHVKYLALGNWASELKKWPEARTHLQQALKFGLVNASQIYYLIGHTFKEQGEYQNATESFNRALEFNPPQNISYQTRFEFSEMAMLVNKPERARNHLLYLEKRWRGTPNYPDIIWRLLGVELKENRRHLACRWARKLYSKYPGANPVSSWGIELEQNKYEGKTLGCIAGMKDIKDRVRNLNLSGLAARARAEIDFLRARARPSEREEIDFLLVHYLEHQGYPDEALKILTQYYKSNKNNLNYQNSLGKVAGRAGEFQTAIGAYYNAYKLSPGSSNGKNALFTAAFLSYQIQDYDGAFRKFSQLADKFAGSGLARDAKWHLAWLQYLKTDYAGAEQAFRALKDEKYYVGRRRKRKVIRPFDNERTRYWLAMSMLRQEKHNEARGYFEKLASDKSMSFYALAASNRLVQIPKSPVLRTLASNPAQLTLTSEHIREDVLSEAIQAVTPQVLFSPSGESEVLADESEDDVKLTSDSETQDNQNQDNQNQDNESSVIEESSSDSEPVVPSTDGLAGAVPASEDEQIKASDFLDPKLRERFQRANNLISIGLQDWAKWELFEIERRTSNKAYLKMLMEAYSQLGYYNRVSYISEIYFSTERSRGGIREARDLWMYGYPKAYAKDVSANAQKFNVQESLVLAIMRAESNFNKEAYSPVGARGLMQIMPYTANQIAKLLGEANVTDQDLLSPQVNIRLGSRYLSRLQKKFQDLVPLVAAGYNAGPHRVYSWLNTFGSLEMDEFIEHVPFVETRNYMKRVVRNYAIYNTLYGNKNDTNVWLTQPVPMRVSSRPSPRENWEFID